MTPSSGIEAGLDAGQSPPRRRWRSRAVGIAGQLLVLGAVAWYLLLPQYTIAQRALPRITGADGEWFIVALLCELGSLAAFVFGTRAMLKGGARLPRLRRIACIDLTTIAVSHTVPAGSASSTVLAARLLRQAGVAGPRAAAAKLAQGLGSVVVLQLLLWTALAIAIPLHGASPQYVVPTAVGIGLCLVLLLAVAARSRLLPVLARLSGRIAGMVRRDPVAGAALITRFATQLDLLLADRRRLARALAWGGVNWLFDAAALWCTLNAFGHSFGYPALMVSFAVAQVLAWIPITPAGLGVVEGVLAAELIGFGGPAAIAVLGVLTWRLLNFWLPIPLGAAAYLSLRTGRGSRRSAALTSS